MYAERESEDLFPLTLIPIRFLIRRSAGSVTFS